MATVQAKVTVVGTKPLWWHPFGPESIPLEKQERTGVAGNNPEEWKKRIPAMPDGTLYLPGSYAFACVVNGSRNIKKGRGSIQFSVQSTLEVLDDVLLVDRKVPANLDTLEYNALTAPLYVDVRGVVVGKARHVRYRIAACPGWRTTFTVQWDSTVVSRQEMIAAIHDAGKLAGMGDGRRLGMGRFRVESVEEIA